MVMSNISHKEFSQKELLVIERLAAPAYTQMKKEKLKWYESPNLRLNHCNFYLYHYKMKIDMNMPNSKNKTKREKFLVMLAW